MNDTLGDEDRLQRTPRFRIGLVSEVRLYREAVGAALARTGDLLLVDCCAQAEAVFAGGCEADALLLDIGGRADPVQIRRLAGAVAPRPVVGFGVGSVEVAVDCIEAGLAGFVPADGSVADLVSALRAALAGRLVCSPEAVRCMAERLAARAFARPWPGAGGVRLAQELTSREREIAGLVGDGWSNKEIAKALAISPATVKNHVHIILEKLQVERRARVASRLRETGPGVGARP